MADANADSSDSLNSQNLQMLRALVIAHIIACLVWVAGDHLLKVSLSDVKGFNDALGAVVQSLSVGFLTLASLATIAMRNLWPRHWMAHFVYLKRAHPLPGCRAFSEYMNTDDRIDVGALTTACGGTLPVDSEKQNAMWYKFLVKQQELNSYIAYTHRVNLLLMDSAGLILVLLPLVAIIFGITHSFPSGWILLTLMVGEFFIACVAAHNSGIGLVN